MAKKHAVDVMLGTAGHIDHGKSSLIRALTGTDPDRLAEEKRRGITIELGFAQLTLPDGRAMGVVDVPGHERFVRQMIAGATGIDLALLVIAADDGVMPQTIEHVAVLETLGIGSCVVALTKTDLVDAEWVEFMQAEVGQYLESTSFAGSPVVPVSSRTGEGLESLTAELARVSKLAQHAKQERGLRLPVDRSFSITGAGTVVTGTLWSGEARPDQVVRILPAGTRARIRSVQEHGAPVESARAGNRVALNLAGISTDEVRPGDFLVSDDLIEPTDRFDARLTYLDTAKTGKPLVTGARMHVAHGTREGLGRVLLMDGRESLKPGESALVQIRLEEPLAVCAKDRFVVRTYSPVAVAGGGEVLIAHPRRRTLLSDAERDLLGAIEESDFDRMALALLALSEGPIEAREEARRIGCSEGPLRDALLRAHSQKRALIWSDRFFITQAHRQRLLQRIERALLEFHSAHPQEIGMTKDELRRGALRGIAPDALDVLLAEAKAAGTIVETQGRIGHPRSQGAAAGAIEELAGRLLPLLEESPLAPPLVHEAATALGVATPQASKAAALLAERGDAVRISAELYFATSAIERAKEAARSLLATQQSATVAELKDAIGTSRKYAVPLLEYFDALGFTVREGDGRRLG